MGATVIRRAYEPVLAMCGTGAGYVQTILTHGVEWEYKPTPRKYKMRQVGQCFRNAYQAALHHSELTYCEGYAYSGILPLHHAWCVDRDGFVVDLTWRNSSDRIPELEYLGIPFKFDYVTDTITRMRCYSVFGEYGNRKIVEDDPTQYFEPRWLARRGEQHAQPQI